MIICSQWSLVHILCFLRICTSSPNHSERLGVGQYLAQFPGLVIFKRVHEKYWLPTPPSHPRERLFYLKRVLIRQGSSPLSNPARLSITNTRAVIKFPLNLLFLVIISVALVICAWLSAQWIALLVVSMDSPWLLGWLLASVVVVPSVVFYSCMMLYGLYAAIGHFLVDVMRDAGADLDNDVPV
jgi:hypothetical protein